MAELKIPRRARHRHRTDPLPPPTRENWLGLALMVGTTVSMPVVVYAGGFPADTAGQLSLLPVLALAAYYLFLGLGMWLVRPMRGHGTAYRVAFAYLHLQAACYLLMWTQSLWGVRPNPFRPQSAYTMASTFFTVFGFVPAFVLWRRSREYRLLFWVEILVPFGIVAAVGVALFMWLYVEVWW